MRLKVDQSVLQSRVNINLYLDLDATYIDLISINLFILTLLILSNLPLSGNHRALIFEHPI